MSEGYSDIKLTKGENTMFYNFLAEVSTKVGSEAASSAAASSSTTATAAATGLGGGSFHGLSFTS